MTAILRLQLDDKDPVRVNSAINQLAESYDRNARSRLTAATTFYVSTSGSDSNSGSQASPFLTIQHAYDTIVSSIDTAGFTVTIQLADGTYTSGLAVQTSWSGGGQLVLQGNASIPDNVVISTTSRCINLLSPLPAKLTVQNLKITSSAENGIYVAAAAAINIVNVNFGACAGVHVVAATPGGNVTELSCKISGSAVGHWFASQQGLMNSQGQTLTLVGTLVFSNAFVIATELGCVVANGMTFVGSFTGTRYVVQTNSVIDTGGGGANYFPGSAPGSAALGGIYL